MLQFIKNLLTNKPVSIPQEVPLETSSKKLKEIGKGKHKSESRVMDNHKVNGNYINKRGRKPKASSLSKLKKSNAQTVSSLKPSTSKYNISEPSSQAKVSRSALKGRNSKKTSELLRASESFSPRKSIKEKNSKSLRPSDKGIRNPELTKQKVQEVNALLQQRRRFTIAEACQQVGISQSYYFKLNRS